MINLEAIEVKDLVFKYGEKTAVDHISFEVKSGEIFGFLGPNGAGKSTTIKVLTTLLKPTSGEVKVLGFRLPEQDKEVRQRIGVVLQDPSYEYNLNVENSLDVYGLMWDLPKRERKRRMQELIREFDLEEYRKTRMHDLSIGMRRRVQVAREFMHDMDLLFLDEPTVGLDVVARRNTLDKFREWARSGHTVFFTTHIMEEADYLCDRIAVINEGKIIAIDTPRNLKELFGGTRVIDVRLHPYEMQMVVEELKKIDSFDVRNDMESPGRLQIFTDRPLEAFKAVTKALEAVNVRPISVSLEEPSLEKAFMNLLSNNGGNKK